jgi:hypothetical protein
MDHPSRVNTPQAAPHLGGVITRPPERIVPRRAGGAPAPCTTCRAARPGSSDERMKKWDLTQLKTTYRKHQKNGLTMILRQPNIS